MSKQKENIDFFVKEVFTICLFLFTLFIFKSSDYTNSNSFNKSFTIEHVSAIDNSAILIEPLSFPKFENSLVSCDLFTFHNSNKDNFKIIYSNINTNHLFRLSKERFTIIKPQIIDFNLYHIRTSLTNEDNPLIS